MALLRAAREMRIATSLGLLAIAVAAATAETLRRKVRRDNFGLPYAIRTSWHYGGQLSMSTPTR